ncbi:DUF5988 family protein [Streptomyces buecherae]|uniref:DUF5988 family protein n=1 Tax=Streptomyces buecherae TaxID=2763006 RepID=UPI0036B9B983
MGAEIEVWVLLCGGPADFPEEKRHMKIAFRDLGDRVAVRFRSGYEHFEHAPDEETGEIAGVPVHRYRWLYQTEIAE